MDYRSEEDKLPSASRTVMGIDVGSVGSASGATEVDNVNLGGIGEGDSLGGTTLDNASGVSGTHDDFTCHVLHGSVVSSAISRIRIKRDFDGNIVTVEKKVVTEAVMREGTFEKGTPVTYQTSSDGSKILLLTKRSTTGSLKTTGNVDCGTDIKETQVRVPTTTTGDKDGGMAIKERDQAPRSARLYVKVS